MSLHDREKAFEAKFEHDQELKFRIAMRRAKLFGAWVAEQLGLSGPDADAYAGSMVQADLEEPGIEDMIRKANADLEQRGIEISHHQFEIQLGQALDQATDQVMSER